MKSSTRNQKKTVYDAVIIGGGPSGSATATLLGKKGYKVLVLEKTRFPRFSVGESLIPETYWPLKNLDMLEKMKNSHFVKKYSVQFIANSGKASRPFYFFEANPHESSMTWQVLRSEFDSMMLENAREHGAEVRMEAPVADVLLDGDRVVGVKVVPPNGNGGEEDIYSRVVIDASGRLGFLGRRFRLRVADPQLRKMAYFAHYENARRDTGIDEGATLVLYIRQNLGWFWWIPLHENRVSIGVVSSPEVLQAGRPSDPVRVLEEEIELCPALKERLVEARRVSEVYVISDYSYRTRKAAGDGWLLVGDSFGFLDPIYSTGVLLGLRSAELAAEVLDQAFQANDLSAQRLGAYGSRLSLGIEAFRKLVYAFYTPTFSFAEFVRNHPDQRINLISLLSGDVFREEVYTIFPVLGKYCTIPDPIPLEDERAVETRAGM